MMLLTFLFSFITDTDFKSFISSTYSEEKQLIEFVESSKLSNFEKRFISSFKYDEMLSSHPTMLLDSYEAYIEKVDYQFNDGILKSLLSYLKHSDKQISFNQIMYIQVLAHHLKSDAVPALTEFIGNDKLQTICLSSLSIATGMQYQSLENISDLSKLEL